MKELTQQKSNGLKQYNPEKGLKTIAVAEAAEKHFARAKDAEKLFEAIEIKLKAQAEFVLWWDGQEGHRKRGGGARWRNESVTPKAGKDGIPERMVISRWRQLLDEAKLIRILAGSREKCRRICEMENAGRHDGLQGEYEWYTPEPIIEAAREVMGGIDLDPASCEYANRVVQASEYFTEKDNGLLRQWHGNVWLNPPFAHPTVKHFADKLMESLGSGVDQAVWLSNACVDVVWWHQLAEIGIVCFHKGRIKFYGEDGDLQPPTLGQSIFYFGDNRDKFRKVFSKFGVVLS